MNGKFIVYALVVSLVSTVSSWNRLISSPGMQGLGNTGSSYSGSSWSSNTGSSGSWSNSGTGSSHK